MHLCIRIIILVSLVFVVVTISYISSAQNPMEVSRNHFPSIIPLNSSQRNKADNFLVFSYGDLDTHLCDEKLDWNKKLSLETKSKPCPENGIVTIRRGARTGNEMWDYATVWATARHTGLKPFMPKCTKSALDAIFEGMSIPGVEEIANCPLGFITFAESMEKWSSINQSIIFPRYTLQPEIVLLWVNDLVKEYQFKKELRDKAQETLATIVKALPEEKYTFVGVHVRRTDYIPYIKGKYGVSPVDRQFFLNAMDYFKNKYSNCVFIVTSDDPKWCSRQFENMTDVYVRSYSPAQDLAILASCNHSIFDYGTFGEWAAILAGGETIYSNGTPVIPMGTGKILDNWIMM